MARPDYNPPNNDCPECEGPSRTYSLGGKTEDGVAIYSWQCEHQHRWEIREPRKK